MTFTVGLVGVSLSAADPAPSPAGQATVAGTVVDETGPVAGAVVRVQTTDRFTRTDSAGRFVLSALAPTQAISLSAWAPGNYVAGGDVVYPGDLDVRLKLRAHPSTDHVHYQWMPSVESADPGRKACADCHSAAGTGLPYSLPADEWRQDAHAHAAVNPRFLSMYNGTDLAGNQSPPTRYATNRDYGRFPLAPDANQPYFGPGHKLDVPQSAGNCAACHAPVAAVDAPYGVDPNSVTGVGQEGIACDFCHKVFDVRLDDATGLPHENMPGVLSFELRRPAEGQQFFAGPLDDVAPGDDAYSPLHHTSQFCAPCHHAVFWDTVVYDSFGEWLRSPYRDPKAGKTCQECHMPRLGASHFARPDRGGRRRDPSTIFSHQMPGAADQNLLENTVTMTVAAEAMGSNVTVQVTIRNDRAGHHVPTDSPLRHLLLLITATAPNGTELKLVEGPTIPAWGGVGDPAQGAYAGRPGKAFAKILEEVWTGVTPTAAYWNPTRVVSDNRIPALHADTSIYVFRRDGEQPVTIHGRLLYRRAFYELQRQKGWNVPDVLMEAATVTAGKLPSR